MTQDIQSDPTPETVLVPRRRMSVRLIGLAGALMFAVVLAECGLRIVGIGKPQLYQPDQHCGSRLCPDTSGVWVSEGHGNIRINSIGFRGPEVTLPKPEGVFRIAVLGDSFIEALQVNEHQTFCRVLSEQLSRKIQSCQFEIINCGVSGYGTAQQLQMLRHHVAPLTPDAVLLAVFPGNDIRNNLRSLEQDPARPYYTLSESGDLRLDTSFRTSDAYLTAASTYEQNKRALINRSRLLQLLHSARNRTPDQGHALRSQSVEDGLAASVSDNLYCYSESSGDQGAQAWLLTERLISAIADECQRLNTSLIVFTVSTPAQVYPDAELRARLQRQVGVHDLLYADRRIQQLCASAGIDFVPLASQLQHNVNQSGDFYHGFGNTVMGRGHWNHVGHAAAAGLVARYMIRSGFAADDSSDRPTD